MVEDEKYCIDILTQISALTSALEAVAVGLLDDHLRHCVVDAARLGGAEADAKITEATAGDRPPGALTACCAPGAFDRVVAALLDARGPRSARAATREACRERAGDQVSSPTSETPRARRA